jgi:hypothetical protein
MKISISRLSSEKRFRFSNHFLLPFQKPEITYMLEDYRIGNLNEVDVAENEAMEEDDPWVNEPRRHPALRLIHILNIEN